MRTGSEIGERAGGGAGRRAAAGERGGGDPAQEARVEKGLGLEEAEPWPEAVTGDGLLDELDGVLRRFVVLPGAAGEALALWVLHTYAFELREVSTYVGVESPEKRCGKTTLLTVLSELVRRPVVAANISALALFRVIEEAQPTLLIDEADTLLYGNDELRGILNSGYTELWLAEQLRPYGIRPTTIRIGEEVGRGYAKEDFTEVFLRYIPASEVEALRQRS